jgi:opine dehydrogenase
MRSSDGITVFGAGHGGKAMAAHLAMMGARVTLYNRTWKNIRAIDERGGVSLHSSFGLSGFGEIHQVTSDIKTGVQSSRLLMLVVPAFAHVDLAEQMAPYLSDGQIIVLNPGRTFGAFQFRKALAEQNCQARVIVAESQTFIFASRSEGPAQSFIHRIKDAVPLAAFPALDTEEVLDVLNSYYPQFIDGKSVFHTGLDNIGAIFHPTITLHNAGWIEATRGEFQFYIEGVTPAIARVMEAVDRERIRIGQSLGIELISACDWLRMAYDAEGENLYERIRNQDGYRGIKAPATVNHRYINEDIPMSLVPMASLGRKLGIRVRGMESIIRLASIIRGKDYWAIGRTVERLGMADHTPAELLTMAAGAIRPEHFLEEHSWHYLPAG